MWKRNHDSTRPAWVPLRVLPKPGGEPTTHDEVRGYWVFLPGVVSGTLGIVLFIPSTAPRATSLTLREASIFIAAVGLVTMVAGPVLRLPVRSWVTTRRTPAGASGSRLPRCSRRSTTPEPGPTV